MATWTRRTARKAENRERLIAAATDLFAEKGYWGVSLDEVAERAGLTKGAVYSSFENKEALLMAVAWDQRIELPDEGTGTDALAFGEQMRRLGRAIARLTLSTRFRAVVPRELELSTLALTSERVRTTLVEVGRRQRAAATERLEAAAREQNIRLPLPAAETAAILSAVRTGLMRMRRLDPEAIPVHYFEDAFELIATGAVVRSHKKPSRKPAKRK
jgi:AcrR family transcriptional regulator